MTEKIKGTDGQSWTSTQQKEFRKELESLSEESYREFNSKILPDVEGILGVRVPAMRKIAKRIAKTDWQAYLKTARDDSFEEVMMQGIVLGYAKGNFSQKKSYIQGFVPKIQNWAVCDIFCGSLKVAEKDLAAVWEFLQPYLKSEKEYEIRFGVVMLLNYYKRAEYLEESLRIFASISHPAYYVKMAVAWAVSMYYVVFPKEVLRFLEAGNLEPWTYEKTLQKIIESRQITDVVREEMRERKRALRKRETGK